MNPALHEETTSDGVRIRIYQDPDATSPFDWDLLGTLYSDRRKGLGYHKDIRSFDYLEDFIGDLCIDYGINTELIISLESRVEALKWKFPVLVPVKFDKGYVCSFEEAPLERANGIWLVTQAELDEAAIGAVPGYECVQGHIQAIDEWLRGNVYGYVVALDGEKDSCWGFYPGEHGEYEYCLGEAREAAKNLAQRIARDESECRACMAL